MQKPSEKVLANLQQTLESARKFRDDLSGLRGLKASEFWPPLRRILVKTAEGAEAGTRRALSGEYDEAPGGGLSQAIRAEATRLTISSLLSLIDSVETHFEGAEETLASIKSKIDAKKEELAELGLKEA